MQVISAPVIPHIYLTLYHIYAGGLNIVQLFDNSEAEKKTKKKKTKNLMSFEVILF